MQVLKLIFTRLFFPAILIGCSLSESRGQGPAEHQLKAVFLFNFTQFVDWPPGAFATKESPLVIGVLGKNPFGIYLDETVAGEKKNGRPVVVQYYKNEEELKPCHILYINLPESRKRREVIEQLRGKNVLTISDANDFTRQGGIIRFFTSDNKIRFQINLASSKLTELVISSKLLRIADIYEPQSN